MNEIKSSKEEEVREMSNQKHSGGVATESQDALGRWVFTFGAGHRHPITNENLDHRYVVVEGSYMEARAVMEKHFGRNWAFQYASEGEAGVQDFGLKEIALPLERLLPCPFCGVQPLPHETLGYVVHRRPCYIIAFNREDRMAWNTRSLNAGVDRGWQPIEDWREYGTFEVWLETPDRTLNSQVGIANIHKNATIINGHFSYDMPKILYVRPLPDPPSSTYQRSRR